VCVRACVLEYTMRFLLISKLKIKSIRNIVQSIWFWETTWVEPNLWKNLEIF